MFWGGSRSTKRCVFPCEVAAAGDERYLVFACAAVAGALVSTRNRFSLGVLQRVVVHVHSSLRFLNVWLQRFLNVWLQIALEWLHECCHLVLARA